MHPDNIRIRDIRRLILHINNSIKISKNSLSKQSIKYIMKAVIMAISVTAMSSVNAANNKSHQSDNANLISIDFSSIATPKHELALMQALSEVCPTVLKSSQRANFNHAYNAKLHRLMPAVANPNNALKYLSTKSDYRKLRAKVKIWTLSYSKAENRGICEDLSRSEF